MSFDGLHDYEGRPKHSFQILEAIWGNQKTPPLAPHFKILKPALGTFEGSALDYHAIILQNDQWKVIKEPAGGTQFEWKLVRTDGFNNPVEMTDVGNGPRLTLTIPKHPSLYRLYLYVVQDGIVNAIIESQLNTPLKPGPGPRRP